MPVDIRITLASELIDDLRRLAQKADALWLAQSQTPELCQVEHARPRKQHQKINNQKDFCYYHGHYGKNRVYTVRENQGKTYLFRDGQGKSGKIRESQGIQRKSQGKLRKSQRDFFGKFLPPMNQDPLFILAIVCQTSLTSYFSIYLDIFLL